MTAAGKITAARVQAGDRILVKVYSRDVEADAATLDYLGKDWALGIATTKTGAGVRVARVLSVEAAQVTGRRRAARVYDIHTTEGTLGNNAPAQTMILAPEDAAGVKRAHAEALALNATMDAYPAAEEAAPEAVPTIVAELKADPPTSSSALVLIGRCWAGGTHTGSALKAWHAGDFTLAAAFALDQLSLQAEAGPLDQEVTVDTQAVARDAYWTGGCGADVLERHRREAAAAGEERGRLAEAKLAQAILRDYQEAARVIDAPKAPVYPVTRQANGTLMVENAAGGDPAGQEVTGRAARVVRGDVVRIHRETALYEVLEVQVDRALDRTKRDAVPEDFSMARLVPLDPEDERGPRWESLDLLHRVPPVARVRTMPVDAHQELAEDPVAVTGAGWEEGRGDLRQVALVDAPGSRLGFAALLPWPGGKWDRNVRPVGCLRIGDAIVINDRCFTVTWDGGPAEPRLEPQRWRDR